MKSLGSTAPVWRKVLLSLLCMITIVGEPLAAQKPSVDQRIRLAAAQMLRLQLDSGLFVYEHDFLSGANSTANNIVRQAGAGFALGEYYRFSRDPFAARALKLALEGYRRSSVAWKDGLLLAANGKLQQAKAGATALAILTLLLASDDTDALRSDELLDDWVEGILGLQLAHGGFEAKPGTGKQSAYSDGEIWLALATHVDILGDDSDKRVRAALRRADERFITQYGAQPEIGFFHWGMMAASLRYRTTRDPAFTTFIAEQITHYLEQMRPRVSSKSNSCYSVEGMLSALEALQLAGVEDKLREKIRKRVGKEMKKNQKLQILPEQKRIRFGRNHYLAVPHLDRYAGAFLNGRYRPQIRIDATQHCLSALIKSHTLLP
jgi:hypothetical protein